VIGAEDYMSLHFIGAEKYANWLIIKILYKKEKRLLEN
jgi:hypothetical protein